MDQLLARLKPLRWHFIHRRIRSPFYMHILWEGCSNRFSDRLPFDYAKLDWIALDTLIAGTEPTWEALRKIVNKHLSKSPRLLLKLLKASYRDNAQIEKFCLKLEAKDLSKASRAELLKYWTQYVDSMNKFAVCILPPLFIEPDMEAQLKKIIVRNFPDGDRDHIFQVLTTPQALGAAQQDEEALLKLAVKFKAGKLADAAVKKYLREFAWIKNNSFVGTFFTKAEVLRRVKHLAAKDPAKKLKEFLQKHAATKREFAKYYKVIAKSKRDKALVDTLQESIFHRSWRTERYYRNAYFLQGFFAATARELGLKHVGDLFYLIHHEITGGLRGEIPAPEIKKLIAERRQGYMVYTEPGLSVVYSGRDLAEAKRAIKIFGTSSAKEVNGACAYPGKVVARAIVVKSKLELHKIKPGCVLVAPSTTVDFVPYLKKVKAIVTDEGGVLSHASVMSRELHIPCVIGTKQGTEILKDGMKLSVDAGKGQVKVL